MDGSAVATTASPRQLINHESQVFVRTCNRTITLNVNLRSDSVEEVTRLIEEREGIPVTEQHLVFGGKPLRHGTFLRDYDALGDQSTINVLPRIRGGTRTGDKALRALLNELIKDKTGTMTRDVSIPGNHQGPQELTEIGASILHGVLTCILGAHRAGLSFDGACGMDELKVHVYEGKSAGCPLVVSRVYHVPADPNRELVLLDGDNQKEDYKALTQVIETMFQFSTPPPCPPHDLPPLHVGSICKLLRGFTGDTPSSPAKDITDLARRTHLLQAYAAMISSPVAVSTMCLNLKRLYQQLHHNHRSKFQGAMRTAQETTRLHEQVRKQPLFNKVYDYEQPLSHNNNNSGIVGSVPNNQYAGDNTGMEMLNFARNWFTHVPNERWPEKGKEKFKGLPHLDCIFTNHFPSFIPAALLYLYKEFDDYNLLTSVLVPLALPDARVSGVSTQPR